MNPRARWPNTRSVRVRTTASAILIVAVALIVGAVVLVGTLERSLATNGDSAAIARARDLAALAESGDLPRTVTAPVDDGVVQVVDATGRVIAASAGVRGADPVADFALDASTPTVRTVDDVPDGTELESYRIWGLRADTSDGPVQVYVGTSLEQVSEATAALRTSLLVGLPVLLLLLGYVTWTMLGRTLRPVESIRARVADISGRNLDRRVPVPPTDDEISRLAVTMNAMLDRLEAAGRRQRQFVADASHELQSPLVSFRAQLGVSLAHPDETDWPSTAVELLADSDRMERIVADLLFLARTDAVPPHPPTRLVDLDDVVLDEVGRLREHAPVRLDTSGVSAAPVRGDGEDLRRMARNLLDNAVRHADTAVHVQLESTGDHVVLVVQDDGPGVPAAHRERIFERFVRLDDARPHAGGGTGLGLAIVRAIAERHGGTVVLEPSEKGTRMVVRLPVPDVVPDHVPPSG